MFLSEAASYISDTPSSAPFTILLQLQIVSESFAEDMRDSDVVVSSESIGGFWSILRRLSPFHFSEDTLRCIRAHLRLIWILSIFRSLFSIRKLNSRVLRRLWFIVKKEGIHMPDLSIFQKGVRKKHFLLLDFIGNLYVHILLISIQIKISVIITKNIYKFFKCS